MSRAALLDVNILVALFDPDHVHHRQLTDVYLLGLAVNTGGRLATFDRAIPLGAVVGATRDAVAVISPQSIEGSAK